MKAYFKWKEQLVCEDAGRYLVFEAPMGASTPNVYVPTEAAWASKVPHWAKAKREQVVRAVRDVDGVVVEDPGAWVEEKPS